MLIENLYQRFAERKRKIEKLANNGNSLSSEKKAELIGAANEIGNFLKALDYYTKPEMPKAPRPSRKLGKIFD